MDLDGDGIKDIITGSYNPGDLYFFKGNKDRTFAKGEKLTDKNGKNLNIGTASTPFAVDFDGDGDLDLLIGDQRGHVFFVPNESGGKGLKFGAAKKIAVGGTDIKVGGGDSQPVACDFDGDGKLDILVGCGDGEIRFYRGTGEAVPALEKHVVIVPKSSFKYGEDGPIVVGIRTKLCLADFNGDGVPDLLVGDYASAGGGLKKGLSEEERKKAEELQTQSRELAKITSGVLEKAWEDELKKLGKTREELTDAEMLKVATAIRKVVMENEDYKKAAADQQKVFGELRKYIGPRENRGYVWFLAGKGGKADRPEITPGR